MKIVQKYDLSNMKPLIHNDIYALYGMEYINDKIRKGVRLDKRTNKQVDVIIEMIPKVRVIEIITNGVRHKLY